MAFSEREIRAALRKKEGQSSTQPGEAPVSDEEKASGIVLHCPHCNAVVDDDAVFCQDCGRPLSEKPDPEQILMEAKGENSQDTTSLWAQPGIQQRKEKEEQEKRDSRLKKFWFLVLGLSFFVGSWEILFPDPPFHPPPPKTEAKSQQAPPKTEAELQQALPATRTRINYKIVHSFYFTHPSGGRSVVIDPKYRNEPDLRRFGAQLQDDFRNDGQVYILVYDDERAALMRDSAVLDDRLSKEDEAFHDRHCLGIYMGRGDDANFTIMPEGLYGRTITVEY